MPQISRQEFEPLPLPVRELLAGVPLHDVWVVNLPRARSGITLEEFLRTASARPYTPSPLVRALLNIRFFVGRRLGWDGGPGRNRLGTLRNAADNRRSLQVPCASGHARGTFSRCIPLRERAAAGLDQPHRTCRSAERPCGNGKWVPLLFRRLCAQRQPLHANLHGFDRPIPQAGGLSVTPALRPREGVTNQSAQS